eukprot:s35_g34.t1
MVKFQRHFQNAEYAKALDQREHLASLARDAVEDRFRMELQTLSEATSKSLHALQEDVAKNEEHSVQEVQYLGCRIDAVLEEIAKVQQSSRETAEASAHMVNATLADFRTQELHNQANEYRELRGVTSSVAQGVLRLAQAHSPEWRFHVEGDIGAVVSCESVVSAMLSRIWSLRH